MLTVDLVRARRRGDRLQPVYLRGDARERLAPVARFYCETYARMVGERRSEVDAVLATAEVSARDRVAAQGLLKLVDDAAVFETVEGVDPEAIRKELFTRAAAARRALGVTETFDRDAVLAATATHLGTTSEALDAALFADLRGSEVLKRMRPIGPEEVLERYNLALAQAVLIRAVKVTVRAEKSPAAAYRALFRAARFHQLLHVVRREGDGYVIELDGPFSLFDSVQRYGVRLALFLPSVLALESFQLRADIRWGKERAPLVFEVSPGDALAPDAPGEDEEDPIAIFVEAFRRLESRWDVKRNSRIFALPGEVVCLPDLVFESRATGETVYLETFGFWSRAAVWHRIELLRRRDFPARVLLAVGKQLRVSEELLGEDDAGELYVFGRAMSPRAVLERLERAL